MTQRRPLLRDEQGATTIEVAFALPVFIIMMWALLQFGLIFRASAGIQQALGEGARYATLCLNPTSTGCSSPTAADIKAKIAQSVYGVGPGTFTVAEPVSGKSGTSKYYDLTVSYSQATTLLILPGPVVNVSRSKRVWIAAT